MCDLAIKISKFRHTELFKTCVQNKQELFFSFFIINQYCTPKCVLKPSEELLFSLFIINHVRLIFVILQKVCSKQSTCRFLVYQVNVIRKMRVINKRRAVFQFIKLLFVLQKNKYIFKTSRGLLFSLLNYYCNKKNLCLKQARADCQFINY